MNAGLLLSQKAFVEIAVERAKLSFCFSVVAMCSVVAQLCQRAWHARMDAGAQMTAAAVICALCQCKGQTQAEQQIWHLTISQAITAGHLDGVLTMLHTSVTVGPLSFN